MVTGMLVVSRAFAQNLSAGVVVGASLTDSFQNRTVPVSFPTRPGFDAPSISNRFFSPSRDYIVGGMLELRFNSHWSMEVNGLFRQLHMTTAGVLSDGSLTSISPSPVVTWEFPVLAKYRFQGWKVNPFVEAGPSFRTAGNLNGTNPSDRGIAVGLGVEMDWRGLKVAPAARYTRWAEDNIWQDQAMTAPSQVEMLVRFSRVAESKWRPLGRRMSLGVMLGTNLTGDFRTTTQQGVASDSSPVTIVSSSGPRSFIVGPAVEFKLRKSLFVEVDALYRPVSAPSGLTSYADGTRRRSPSIGSFVTWEFPVLAKYRFPVRCLEPFIALGPSFRLPQSLNQASTYGIVAGAGMEVRVRHLKIAPAIRYTHWAPDDPSRPGDAVRNQSEFLVGFSF